MTDIARQRLQHQHLLFTSLNDPADLVARFGAVQAQDYPGAKWALGLRLQQAADSAIEKAFNEGAMLRTHVMRPTWHFVTPEDIRWLLALTAPRVNAVNAYMYRQTELDETVFERSNAVLADALRGGQFLTRSELGAALAKAGIVAEGVRLAYIILRAELDAVVCSGPRRGKQFTYALLDERAPQARVLERDEALAELTRRYYSGHGPATIRDFAWWSGLTVADGKAGLAMVDSQLDHAEIDGQTYWFSASSPPAPESSSPTAFLLPTYDEFLVGFAAFGQSRSGGQGRSKLIFDSTIVLDGRVIGSWKRTLKKDAVQIEIAPFDPLTTAEQEAVAAAVRRYGDFLGLPVDLSG